MSPGPGSYQIPEVLGRGVARYSLRSKSPTISKKMVPGPGNYDIKSVINAKPALTQFPGTRNVVMAFNSARFPKSSFMI